LDALKGGVDGVIVRGCHPGNCHYRVNKKQEKNENYLNGVELV
jgi:coenzyme F420-reducing hydrogenase delta subunit